MARHALHNAVVADHSERRRLTYVRPQFGQLSVNRQPDIPWVLPLAAGGRHDKLDGQFSVLSVTTGIAGLPIGKSRCQK
jgi:hypothetical protein